MLGGWMMALADRLILNRFVDTAEVGLYSVAYTLGAGMNLISASINYAWAPFFMSQMKDRGDAAKVEIARFVTYWVGGMCFVFLLISLFSREILIVLTASQYHVAYRVVPLIALGYLFSGFYYVVANPLFWLGKTPLIAVATITGGLLNVGLNFLLVPHMQMTGSALATTLSHLSVFVLTAFFSLRSFSLPYEYKRLGLIIAATTLCYLLSIPVVDPASSWIAFALKLAIVCIFPLLLLLMGFLKTEEKRAIKAVFVAAVLRVRNSTRGLFRS
jgi:O-antigen/teichoic acid export membrane protein